MGRTHFSGPTENFSNCDRPYLRRSMNFISADCITKSHFVNQSATASVAVGSSHEELRVAGNNRLLPNMRESSTYFGQLNRPFRLRFQQINGLGGHALLRPGRPGLAIQVEEPA
jgi:hypothetical protein